MSTQPQITKAWKGFDRLDQNGEFVLCEDGA